MIEALTPNDESAVQVPETPSISVSSFLSLSLFLFFFVVVFLGFVPLVLGRFRDFKRFQMALILAFLAGALPLTMGLVARQSGFLTRAFLEETPRGVEVFAVTAHSFSVRWQTGGDNYGAIRFGSQPYREDLTQTALEVNGLGLRKEHAVMVSELEGERDYYFEILSGSRWYDSHGILLSVRTLPE